MTNDIHKMITGNPISKNLMKPWGSNSKPNSLRGKLFYLVLPVLNFHIITNTNLILGMAM